MSYLTKDQLENYLNKLPGTNKPNKEYQSLKNDLTYPTDDLDTIKNRMNKLRVSSGASDVRTPSLPETPKPTANTTSPLYIGQACLGCQQQVRGSVVSALNGLWHTQCFKCTSCHKELDNEPYYEKEGGIYCAKDYRRLFSIYCHACNEPIEHQALRVLGKHYHEDHFCCCVCKRPIGDQQFKVHEDQPYCQEDYMKKLGKRCSGCGNFLQGEYVNALGQTWHKQCFHCTNCKQTFSGGSFLVKDNKPYCEAHYPTENPKPLVAKKPATPQKPIHQKPVAHTPIPPQKPMKPTILLRPSIPPKPTTPKPGIKKSVKKECHVCQSVIDGPCASALGHDYHIHHFQCHQCHRSLSSRVPGMWQGDSQGELTCKMCV